MMYATRVMSLFFVLALVASCGKSDVIRIAPPDDEGGGDSDVGTDTDADADSEFDTEALCDKGTYEGNIEVSHHADLTGLAEYTSVDGYLQISDCDSCVHLGALICLKSVEDYLYIGSNDNLVSLTGLSSLTSVGGLSIRYNDALTNIDHLSSLTTAREINILGMEALTDLDGLGALETVSDDFGVTLSYSLTSMNLTSLVSVGEDFIVSNNHALTNLDGLSSLASIGGTLWVFDNASMPDCEVCELIDQLTEGPAEVYTSPNVEDDCTPVPDNCP
jgi:hypothetical protein